MSWEVQFREGIWLPQIGWWLDAHRPAERSFVSHAHFDHLALHAEVLCSPGTARLMAARLPSAAVVHALPFGRTEALGDSTSVTLWPAGHIFGSAQCLLEHPEHGRLLYSGDFKLRQGRSSEPCATPAAEVLIMETTYGRPQYRFPPTASVLAAIARFCAATIEDSEVPVLFGYSLGKSQEILSGLTEAGIPVMLHPSAHRLTKVYEELGVPFPPYRVFDPKAAAGHVVIAPPQAPDSAFLRSIGPRRTGMVTGWALDPGATYRYRCDEAFALSDHADYDDLVRYVEAVRPNRVLTLHGFAADFARDLRERGIEAWAISEANQLDLGLGAAASSASTPRGHFAAESPDILGAKPRSADIFSALAETAESIREAPGKLSKVERLSHYLGSLSDEDAAIAALFLGGRAFPQGDARVLQLGGSLIQRAVSEATGLGPESFREAYRRHREGGEAVEELLRTANIRGRALRLREVADAFSELAASRGPLLKLSKLAELFRQVSPGEGKYLVKIVTGDLRIGLKEGLVEEAIAASTGRSLEAVREAQMLGGDIAATVRAARAGTLGQMEFRVFNPVQFMLASPEPTAESILARVPAPVWVEEKYDGIRCQLHRSGARCELYSRDLRRITDQFPEIARAALCLPADAVIDGELLAWKDGRALRFGELQRRLGRSGDDLFLGGQIPVSLSAYDLLWCDGVSLLRQPLADRRKQLESLLAECPAGLLLAPMQWISTAAGIEDAFLLARAKGNEGLMVKDPASPYLPGRRGLAWLKFKKAFATIDVVVVGVEYGHGKRRDVLSDYTFAVRDEPGGRLLTIGKAYSGLTDAEIARLTTHFLENTREIRGRTRIVEPDTVLEVAFDAIQPSSRHESGLALRFPRIVRIRGDKGLAEIDTLEACRRLAGLPIKP